PVILALLLKQRSTIIFVNSRSLCERLSQRLNDLAQKELVRAHHGSLSLRKRSEIEESLKDGSLRGIVATSSLELGIDMGAVDMVVLVESPGSVARGLQRVGRAGHSVGEKSAGVMFPKFRGDLLECAVVAERMRQGELEPVVVPQNCLDVLAQQLVAMCIDKPVHVDALHAQVTKSYPFHALSPALLRATLDMLSGTYPSDEFADLRPHLSWDRSSDMLHARRGGRLAAIFSAGTIVDRGHFGVFLVGDGPRVGELDEEMVHESRRGDTFLLGASTWRIEEITRDRVVVSPAPGEPGKMPFWRGEGPGRPIELGRAIGAFVRQLSEMAPAQARKHLQGRVGLDTFAAGNLLQYIQAQKEACGVVP
ncbi:MAG: DEAD/DEAH box helicase, partial [Deltaproteobacteria bacterium]